MARGLTDMSLQRLAGELAIAGVHRMARVGVGHPERRWILLEGLGESLARHVMLAGDVGDERTVVALIELGPVGIAQAVEGGESLAGLAVGLLHPGAGEGRGEIGDRPLARRGEMLVSFLVIALLEGLTEE